MGNSSRDKQTERYITAVELTEILCGKPCDMCKFYGQHPKCMPVHNADKIADAGYRKASEVAEEIFAEIENWFELYSEREYSFAEEETSKGHCAEAEAHDYALDIIKDLRYLCVAELKKKYTEGQI